jgi:precorrin-2 dehydrogenase/sirohydrochlorin ferrochelatase
MRLLFGWYREGNVKTISTNGKSPTTAKRLREFFEIQDISQMVLNLNEYRKTLKVILRKSPENE